MVRSIATIADAARGATIREGAPETAAAGLECRKNRLDTPRRKENHPARAEPVSYRDHLPPKRRV